MGTCSRTKTCQYSISYRGAGAGPAGTVAAGPMLEAKLMNLIKGRLQKFWLSRTSHDMLLTPLSYIKGARILYGYSLAWHYHRYSTQLSNSRWLFSGVWASHTAMLACLHKNWHFNYCMLLCLTVCHDAKITHANRLISCELWVYSANSCMVT